MTSKHPSLPSPPHSILVVRRDNIGDLVCTTPFIHALREAFPRAYIGVLVNSYNAAVLHDNPDVDGVFAYTKLKHQSHFSGRLRSICARVRLLIALRRRKFDFAILAKSGFDRHGLRMARWSGAKNILGFAASANHPGLSLALAEQGNGSIHEVEAIGRLLEPLNAAAPLGPLRVFPDSRRQAALRQSMADKGGNRRWLGVHLSAREASRRWPAKHFIDLVKELSGPNLGFIVFWSPGQPDSPTHPGDDPMAAKILSETQEYCVIGLPTSTLEDLIANVACCDIFVGADGGALHIAVAAGVPVVGLYENLESKKRHWYPWQIKNRLLAPHTLPVSDIPVAAVANACLSLLDEISQADCDKGRTVVLSDPLAQSSTPCCESPPQDTHPRSR